MEMSKAGLGYKTISPVLISHQALLHLFHDGSSSKISSKHVEDGAQFK